MNNVAISQAYLFMIFILNGILIGIIFDVFRILRKSFNTPNIITYVEDALFWVISALTVLYTLFVFNNGEIRGYIFIGLFLGIAFYMLFFSKTIIKVSVKIIIFLKEIIYAILKTIIYPLKILLNTIKIPYKFITNICLNMTNNLKKHYKNRLKPKNHKKIENSEGF